MVITEISWKNVNSQPFRSCHQTFFKYLNTWQIKLLLKKNNLWKDLMWWSFFFKSCCILNAYIEFPNIFYLYILWTCIVFSEILTILIPMFLSDPLHIVLQKSWFSKIAVHSIKFMNLTLKYVKIHRIKHKHRKYIHFFQSHKTQIKVIKPAQRAAHNSVIQFSDTFLMVFSSLWVIIIALPTPQNSITI